MAITRRQFVTRLGALAAAAGFSQSQASQIMDALAYNAGAPYQGTFGKPRVVWIHGAECTGCSTSLLGIFENAAGEAIPGSGITTAAALGLAGTIPFTGEGAANPDPNNFLLHSAGLSPDPNGSMDIADLVIDVVDLIYHETVMGMGGDLAYKWLTTFAATNNTPFVLVVEGALQNKANGGAWGDTAAGSVAVPWCSIGMDGTTNSTGAVGEIDMPEMAQTLAESPYCGAVIGIGQCATFGGYPGCKPPITTAAAHFDTGKSQTDALGTYDYLALHSNANVAGKVINVPGCPTNPWWFVLSVVCILVDIPSILSAPVNTVGTLGVLKKVAANANNALGIGVNVGGGVDATRRIKAVYGNPIHGPYCPRYRNYVKGVYASQPGDPGCLQKIGCKGPAAKSLCGLHGWNNQQPQNPASYDYGVSQANPAPNGTTMTGGHCTRAGHPCMACTEKGYPDSFVPFVVR
jgi:hydrogenase small subunit